MYSRERERRVVSSFRHYMHGTWDTLPLKGLKVYLVLKSITGSKL